MRFGLALAGTRRWRAPPRRAYPRAPNESPASAHARPERIPQRLRRPVAQQISPGASVFAYHSGRTKNRRLRTSGIAELDFRRQFKLARPGLVPDQLFADR